MAKQIRTRFFGKTVMVNDSEEESKLEQWAWPLKLQVLARWISREDALAELRAKLAEYRHAKRWFDGA